MAPGGVTKRRRPTMPKARKKPAAMKVATKGARAMKVSKVIKTAMKKAAKAAKAPAKVKAPVKRASPAKSKKQVSVSSKPLAAKPTTQVFTAGIAKTQASKTMKSAMKATKTGKFAMKAPVVGEWVTVKAASRRNVDRAKADTPCLVTLVDDSRVHVLYPNLLSVFLSKRCDGEVAVKFRTEQCELVAIRAYDGDAASLKALDRRMIIDLCKAISNASAGSKPSEPCATTPATPESKRSSTALETPAKPLETPAKESTPAVPIWQFTAGNMENANAWILKFTARVSKAFKAARREVLDKAAFHTELSSEYSSSEISEGLTVLEKRNKVMIADDAIFLVCF